MKILVVDDGQLAINSLIRILCRVAPDCDYISAMTTEDALSWMRQGPMDAAFLNLEMPGMNGLALTRMIQKLQPRCNIIVVTEHPEYALEALQIFVSGFLLKPANEADVRNVLEHLRYPPENAPVGIKIQCFGNFEIFVGGRALAFKRSKSKELDTSKVDCDYYNFLRGSRSATNSYRGEYMTQYSWAEVTRSALRQQANVQKTASIPSYYVPPTGF
jgi:two-component SAPR family response regulator